MTELEVRLLLKKYNCGEASAEEKALLEYWYIHQYLSQESTDRGELGKNVDELKAKIWQETLDHSGLSTRIQSENYPKLNHTTKTNKRSVYLVAAVMILLMGIGVFFYLNFTQPSQTFTVEELAKQTIDIKPGGNRATLTLADGRVIDLNEEKGGIVIDSDALTYTDGTEITNQSAHAGNEKTAYNTITTPKGGQYQVILPDGSKVWLNAASTLKYPQHFAQHERAVELSGEAYFEITKSKTNDQKIDKPFIVKSRTQEIEVLGTHFNVNTYEDNVMATTTLVEGAVNIHPVDETTILKLEPGQQSIVQSGTKTQVHTVDLDGVIGWKNGEFVFYNKSFETVMKDIARWYDIEVIYEDDVRDKKIWGAISRFESISEVLKMIELTGTVRFDIQINGNERRVYIMQ